MPIKNKMPNPLINEKSPYLLQHAYNPVNWYSWNYEAFDRAKSEDKPIFLSIGYSTCHWCHVMENESFEDNEVADILNKNFIAIKVDREERPDIDQIYMNACIALTGSGGWPLTIIMTPEQKPFFAATYIPKNRRMGMKGLINILNEVTNTWEKNKEALLKSSERIANALVTDASSKGQLAEKIFGEAFNQFKDDFDNYYGGFGSSPKFPTPHNLIFLMRYSHAFKDEDALKIATKTLDSMYSGGIYDHIGGGFSRYSTDRKWLVPHFEKMLYDNALLAFTYTEAFKATRDRKYSGIAKEIIDYILRDMTSEEGGFYCAEDADSEGIEGKFYVWSLAEIIDLLGREAGNKFSDYFNITETGNFEGKNIPNLIKKSIPKEDAEFIKSCKNILFKYREKRVHPHKDDKILTSWNGLMIAALAYCGRTLKEDEYISAAEKSVNFIFKNLIDKNGLLMARYRDGNSALNAYAEDYAFLIWGLIELYEATYNSDYLEKALKLNEDLIKYFWDEKSGGLFLYGSHGEKLISRPKEIYDGAIPSANSAAALNFINLSRLTGRYDLEDKAEEVFKAFGREISSHPMAYSLCLTAFLLSRSKTKEIVIVKGENEETSKEFINYINSIYSPFSSSIYYSLEDEKIKKISNFISNYSAVDGKSTAYVCENYTCSEPVTRLEDLKKLIR
ncbi:thioredoxin domain-containing protein [Clostridium sp. 19966]|uniref:thioredoxin domain-containing protein n=1 Tax=Clostridium sp. 19966 TaxID=2768166 RepID=UPI0028E08FA5|nr:thioredoxin domain-containing protein [Clostridium sp. 19966]MDT8716822.1 thioredoxin domain-containing protein [Clostridium sp. 19966]